MNICVCTHGGSDELLDIVLSLEYLCITHRPVGPSAVPMKIRALTNPLITLRSTLTS